MKDKKSSHNNVVKKPSSKITGSIFIESKYKKYEKSKKPKFPPIKYEKPPHH